MQCSRLRFWCATKPLAFVAVFLLRSCSPAAAFDAPQIPQMDLPDIAAPSLVDLRLMGPAPVSPELLEGMPNIGAFPAQQVFSQTPPLASSLALRAVPPVVSAAYAAPAPAGAPSSAPTGAAQPPPQSGDLVKQARARLRASHISLATVAQELVGAQTDVGRTKDSLLGKVYDLESTAKIYGEHQRIVEANTKGRAIVDKLSAQVEGLSMKLAAMHQAIVAREKAETEEEAALHVQVAEGEVAVKDEDLEVQTYSVHVNLSEESHMNITELHATLEADLARIRQQESEATKYIKQTKDAIYFENYKFQPLQQQLVEAHKNGIQCHGHAINLRTQIAGFKATDARKSANTAAAKKQGEELDKSTKQRLMSERVILAAEVQRTESAAATGLATLQQTQEDFKALEADIVRQVQEIKHSVNVTKVQIRNVSALLQEQVGMQQDVVAKRDGLEAQVAELNERLSPILIASLEAENKALEQNVVKATEGLMTAKGQQADASVALEQAWADVDGQRQAANITATAVKMAREEGEKALKSAVAESAVGKAEAVVKQEKAEHAIGQMCESDFALRTGDFDNRVNKCRELHAELSVVKAQEETLKETMTAQQMSMNAM